MIRVDHVSYPLTLDGYIGTYPFRLVGRGAHWVFYVPDPLFPCCGEALFRLCGKYPNAPCLPKPVALRIAYACAQSFAKAFDVFPTQNRTQ
jgi:hypothetical protein